MKFEKNIKIGGSLYKEKMPNGSTTMGARI